MTAIIGIDPGTRKTGVCLLRDGKFVNSQTLRADRHLNVDLRMIRIISLLADYLDGWTGGQDLEIAVENPIYQEHTAFAGDRPYRRSTPIVQLHTLMGGLRVYCDLVRHFKYVLYDMPDIKEGIAGARNATKEEVQGSLSLSYLLHGDDNGFGQPMDPEQWDALAVASYHQAQLRVQEALIEGNPFNRVL